MNGVSLAKGDNIWELLKINEIFKLWFLRWII